MANQTSGKDGKGREMRCSFCGRSQNEVEQLLIGPGVNICNECIDMCHNMLYKDGENPPPPRAGASRRQQAQPAQGDSRQYTDIAGDFDFYFLRHCLLSHDLQNRCVVCEFWRQKDTGAAPCRLGVQRFLGRTFAVQGGDHRLWIQHPDVDGRCAEVR